jgi:hypothetical protein
MGNGKPLAKEIIQIVDPKYWISGLNGDNPIKFTPCLHVGRDAKPNSTVSIFRNECQMKGTHNSFKKIICQLPMS